MLTIEEANKHVSHNFKQEKLKEILHIIPLFHINAFLVTPNKSRKQN